ncbi:zinc finger, C2H2 type [Cooperia oncophora]
MHLESCIVCGAGPQNLSNLYKHLRKHHAWSEERLEMEKIRIKAVTNQNLVVCDECNNVYSSKNSLGRHKQRFHAKEPARILSVVCPVCGERFYSQSDLANHCGSSHRSENEISPDFSVFRGCFSNIATFEVFEQVDGVIVYECCIGHLGHAVRSEYLRLFSDDIKEAMDMLKMGIELTVSY